MHFTTSVAVLAFAASSVSAANLAPYKPAVERRLVFMPLPGQSLARRDTSGYQPEEIKCDKGGDTCATACAEGFTQCDATDKAIHCFNPNAGQICCPGSNGNSCDAGYYCTHDAKNETFCCPQDMDVKACAAAYTVKGDLEIASETSTSTSTSSTPKPPTSTPEPKTTSSVEEEEHTPTPIITTQVKDKTTSICPTPTPAHNSTIIHTKSSSKDTVLPVPTIPNDEGSDVPAPPTKPTKPATVSEGSASTMAFSGLLLVAAGFVALF